MEQANTTQQEQVQTQQPAPAPQAQQQEQPATDAQAQALEQQRQTLEAQHNAAIAAKDQEIANLRAELNAFKKAPGDSTSQVVQTEKKDAP
jgi:hypothetical protein